MPTGRPPRQTLLSAVYVSTRPEANKRRTYVLSELFLIQHIDAEVAVLIPVRDGGPTRVDRPFNPYDLVVGILQRCDVSKGQVTRNLLLQCDSCLRQIGAAGERRIDLQLTHSEHSLESTGYRIGDGFADESSLTHLSEALLRLRRLIRKNRRVGGRGLARSEQGHDLLELQRRVRTVVQLHIVDRAGHVQGDVNALGGGPERQVENRFNAS